MSIATLKTVFEKNTGINLDLAIARGPENDDNELLLRVAVIDGDGFMGWGSLKDVADRVDTRLARKLAANFAQMPQGQTRAALAEPVDGTAIRTLKDTLARYLPADYAQVGHGALVAEVVTRVAPRITALGLFPVVLNSDDRTFDPNAVADQIVQAVEWRADVIVCPWSDPTPSLTENPRLLAALDHALAKGRRTLGTVVVFSTGRPSGNDNANWLLPTVAANHPSVLTVSACDRQAKVYRASGLSPSVFGPAVGLSAPGWEVTVGSGKTAAVLDETSLAAPLVAGVAASVIRCNPELRAFEVRGILRLCATRAPIVDEGPGSGNSEDISPKRLNQVDHDGHNSKLGYGRADAARSVMAAVDPICNAFLSVRFVPDPIRDATTPDTAGLSDRWWRLVAQTPGNGLLKAYLGARAAIVCVLIRSARFREALLWSARHFRCELTDGDSFGFVKLRGADLLACVKYGAGLLDEEARKTDLTRAQRSTIRLFVERLRHVRNSKAATAIASRIVPRR
jgi:Subtilase family